ncbi:hypothetical protein DSAG12_02794 [Promethearchaeum syntrophicum]|uniref:Uncharacterized protein n=1 Tax=Promethearchaeum syntrophicum TaxID=2594042 RepID=A0A5B9DDW7_9ARCH|nr:hypothetical protein [Candidatus Prometheoarchaeum syntrophicum]QEE16963.1 hypothetical protein DSAG12_02794 [Candidatus Prometheoarchaeum syntrophicum]
MDDIELFKGLKTIRKGLQQFVPKDKIKSWIQIKEIKFQIPIPKEPLKSLAEKIGFELGRDKMFLYIQGEDDIDRSIHIINRFTNEVLYLKEKEK